MEEMIVETAKSLFFSYGLKSVSMDDVAKQAGVSKKTIYKDFEDKNQLIEQLVSQLLASHSDALQHCQKEAKNVIDELSMLAKAPFETIASVNPCFFYELRKYFPAIWRIIQEYKQQTLMPAIKENLQRGIASELYRPELDIELMGDLWVQQLMTAINPRSLENKGYHSELLMLQLTEFYLHGITTVKGKKLINKYLNVNNETQLSN